MKYWRIVLLGIWKVFFMVYNSVVVENYIGKFELTEILNSIKPKILSRKLK